MLLDAFDFFETHGECVIGGWTVDPEIAGGLGEEYHISDLYGSTCFAWDIEYRLFGFE